MRRDGLSMHVVLRVIFVMAIALVAAKMAIADEVIATKIANVADAVWIKKSKNRLMLIKDFRIVGSYPIDLGVNPVGHKQREGDGRTPEGLYYIDGRNPNSRYYLSLRVSYPNAHDRRRAIARGDDPGGEIMIHGEPNHVRTGQTLARNWTQGCIAVNNSVMRKLWHTIADGTPVLIEP